MTFLFGLDTSCGQILNQNQDRGGRYFLKIQDGCEQFCSYCIIPYARGPLNNRLSKEVIEEVKAAVAAGFKEIVLSGIHLGLYGINNVERKKTEKGMKLYKLIEQLERIKGLEKIRLSSIEITEVSREMIALWKRSNKLCPHLHIPLQSGCDKILKSMKRPYSVDFFAKRLAKIRRAIPDIAITTDVIVGFPGESEADFKKTLAFIREENFCRLHVFPFSAHPRVLAASLSGQVSEADKKSRVLRLRTLNEELVAAYRRRFVGKRIELVVEAVVDGRIKGKSGHYFDVWFLQKDIVSGNKSKKNLVGEVVEIKMKK